MPLFYKSDYEEALERFEAWWQSKPTDRPLLSVQVGNVSPPLLGKQHASLDAAWMDAEHQLVVAESVFASSRYVAETFPVFVPNLGPDLLSTLFGAELEFAPDTSWAHPTLSDVRHVLDIQPDFETRYWEKIVEMTEASLDRGNGKWLTGYTDFHPHADLLSALRGPEALCLDCVEDPEGVRSGCDHVTPAVIEAYNQLHGLILGAGQPMITWLHAPHQGRMYAACCDFSALISPSMFEEMVLPSVVKEVRTMDRSIYHLDGPTSLQHLELILNIPEIDAVQWVCGAGNGPASRWIDIYRRCQDAGKAVEVICRDLGDVYDVLPQLGRVGAWYYVEDPCSLEEAELAIRRMEK